MLEGKKNWPYFQSKQLWMHTRTLRVGAGPNPNCSCYKYAPKRNPALLESIGELKKAGLNISSVR